MDSEKSERPEAQEGPPPSASGAAGATHTPEGAAGATADSGPSGAGGAADTPSGAEGDAHTPDEEELRAQLEEEIRKVRVEDVVLQSAVSILNLAARRIAKEDERDLGQAKIGIEAARALTDLVTEEARPQLRQAVSELQLLYAKQAGGEDESAPVE